MTATAKGATVIPLRRQDRTLALLEDAEAAFVWCLLHAAEAWGRFGEWIEPSMFPTAADVVGALKTYAASHGARVPTPVVLAQSVRGLVDEGKLASAAIERVLAILDRGEALHDARSFDPAQLCEQVAEMLRVRHSEDLALKYVPALVRGESAQLAALESRIAGIRGIGAAESEGLIVTDPDSVSRALRADRPVGRCPSGIADLDALLGGGYGPGELFVFEGGHGVGKSFALSHAAVVAAEHGRNVLFVTLELSPADIYVRMHGDMLGRDTADLNRRLEDRALRAAAIAEMVADLRAHLDTFRCGVLDVRYCDEGTPPGVVRRMVEAWERRGIPPGLVVVDYGDLLVEGDVDNASMGLVYRQLRAMAIEFGVPVVTASQSQRGGRKRRISDGDSAADGINKVRKADGWVTINQTTEEAMAGVVRLFVAKLRKRAAHQVLGPYPVGYSRGRLVDEGGDRRA